MFFYIYDYLCKEKQVSCKAAAMEMGLSGATAAKWKATGATPNGDTLYKVADYFGKPVEFLLGLTPESHLIELEAEFAEVSDELDADPDNFDLQCRYDALKEQIEDAKIAIKLTGEKKYPADFSEVDTAIFEEASARRDRPGLRIMFHKVENATDDQLDKINAMIDIFMGTDQ